MSSVTIAETPNMIGLLTKAIIPKKGKLPVSGMPQLEVKQIGVQVNRKHLKRFNKVCGIDANTDLDYLPGSYPHILAFPLHMSLLTDRQFPFPLLGLVHLSNGLQQFRRISSHETLDIQCRLSTSKPHSSGISFDVITEVFSAGNKVWISKSTFLYISSKKTKTHKLKKHQPPRILDNSSFWNLDKHLGRSYAKVSGDFNLIHLHKLSAQLFGFKQALIHGMWSKARLLAELEPQIAGRPFEIKVDFKLPVFIPSRVCFNWEEKENTISFQLLDELCLKPHLIGSINF